MVSFRSKMCGLCQPAGGYKTFLRIGFAFPRLRFLLCPTVISLIVSQFMLIDKPAGILGGQAGTVKELDFPKIIPKHFCYTSDMSCENLEPIAIKNIYFLFTNI